jgi:ATPase subunit of ABC transporter with duplicated ATPase domains
MSDFIYINNLSFTYENTIEPLFDAISFQLQEGWTGVVGANGSGKTTLLKLLTHHLIPDSNSIKLPDSTYYCEQRTDDIPSGLDILIESNDKESHKIRRDLELKKEWPENWTVLSHGERKRCQIGIALYLNPSLLAVDEPSNHLDNKSRRFLFNALQSFKGVGLLVSHDRELLDNLCSNTLFVESPNIDLRRSSYTIAANERKRENVTNIRSAQLASLEVKKLKRKVHQQQQKAQQSDRRVSKKKTKIRDHDAKAKIDSARLSGKDAISGKIKRRLQTKLKKSIERKEKTKFKKETTIGISFDENRSEKQFPIIIPPGKISLGPVKSLHFPELTVRYGDKIGIRGNNGSGKSTFIEYLLERFSFSDNNIIFIPQEISLMQSADMIKRIGNYDNEAKGKIMTLISRLGSDPKHVIETTIPSPGEVRKIMLAEGIMLNPGLIIMDEPTNHMDLPSIECVEDALKACPCAQLLVSHDSVFLNNIISEYWTLSGVSPYKFKISVDR